MSENNLSTDFLGFTNNLDLTANSVVSISDVESEGDLTLIELKKNFLRDQKLINQSFINRFNKMDFAKIYTMVKEFDNTKLKSNLKDFISSCELAFKLIKPEEKGTLLLYIKLQRLSGTVAQSLELVDPESWKDLKEFLIDSFEDKHDVSHVQAQFSALKQNDKENVAQYGERAIQILSDIITGYQRLMPNHKEDFPAQERLLRAQALINFTRGLRRDLYLEVKRVNPSNLYQAISVAKDEESILPQPLKTCTICKKTNHVAAECFSNKNKKAVTCTICQKKGHSFENCFKNKTNKNQTGEVVHKNGGNSTGTVPKDLSRIKCNKCEQMGHYANECNQENSKGLASLGGPASALQQNK